MTEPVAWKILRKNNWKWEIITDNPNNYFCQEAIPLYTKQQIQPKVQMTQAEFYEWEEIYNYLIAFSVPVHEMLDQILENKGEESGGYIELAKRVYQDDDFMAISKKQSELINLFINYSPDNPEETIEIVPDMKWFVRSKEPEDEDEDYLFLSGSDLDDLEYFGFDYARAFDTKEEAVLWTNPLTEAVQLAVEEE